MDAQIKTRPVLAGWLGGKSLLAKRIIEKLPQHDCYVEPFCGAAWVLFRKEESKVEVLNDINREVITLYRVVQHHLEEFIRYFKWQLVSRDEFERLKRSAPETLTDIQRAARFYYLQQSAYGGKVKHMSFGYTTARGPKFNLLRIEEYLSAAHLRLARTYIECLPYSEVIKRYDSPGTCFYIDPPYWDCEGDYGQGLFGKEDFLQLARQLAGIKGKFLLSVNDRGETHNIFKLFNISKVETRYSCNGKQHMKARELFVTNY